MTRIRTHQQRLLTVVVRAAYYTLWAGSIPFTVYAGPTGGVITGGNGTISQSSLTTTINQASQNMAIDWQSYNINVDERVQYIQPDSTSISLNRILSNTGSTIAGQIDANGHVILVNPNGVFFTPTSVLNVGSIIASGLDINTTDFMNGDYIFNEVLGTDGAVINSGTINASLGGNVALLGRSVENNGLISASLGTVNLAAGKQAVLTFDNSGLLGVRVSQEILQNELGVDAAVLNSGDINAAGGRVLLTGSVSKDVFSQAVNTGDMQQATSVVVNVDGTFSLGAGADVINSGKINVSSSNNSAGQIVVLGENVTSSGELHANVLNGQGGDIELHAQDTTLLTQNSVTTARAETTGQGGVIKVLGDKVGVFDQSTVDVSGANGGGQALMGGDYQGKNDFIKNATRTTIAPEASIVADALATGNGGKIIVWADEYTHYFGNIFERGGVQGGDGGFAEVSGKEGMVFEGNVDLSSTLGKGGTLLLDPKNITISTATTDHIFTDEYISFAASVDQNTVLNNVDLANFLTSSSISLRANNDITFEADVTSVEGGGALDNALTLQAGRSIILLDNVTIELSNANFTATVNHGSASTACPSGICNREAGPAVFSMGTGSSIVTNKQSDTTVDVGNITINTGTFVGEIGDFTLETLDTSAPYAVPNYDAAGGKITITNSSGNVYVNNVIRANGENSSAYAGGAGGEINITTNVGTLEIASSASIISNGGNAGANNYNGGNGGIITLGAETININGAITSNGGNRTGGSGNDGSGGDITATVSNSLTLNANISSARGTAGGTATNGIITFNGDDSDNIFNIQNDISLTASTVTIRGLAGNDQLVRNGTGVTNTTWTVFDFGSGANGVNDGTLAFGSNTGSNAIRFVNVENLIGSTVVDNFIINSDGSVTGLIDGGAGTTDTLTINTDSTTVQLGYRTIVDAVTDTNLNVNNIETITANITSIGTNIIHGDNIEPTTWTINGANSGIIEPTTGALAENTVQFNNFGQLFGSSDIDTFTVNSSFNGSINAGANNDTINVSGSVSGLIDGGADADQLIITSSGDQTVQISDTDTSSSFTVNQIETINATVTTGNTNGNTLIGFNADTVWTVNSTPSLTYNSNTVDFSGFSILTGGTLVDTFNISADFAGTINGGQVVDTSGDIFNFQAGLTDGAFTGTINGGEGDDSFNIEGTNITFSNSLNGDAGNDTLTAANENNYWTVSGIDTGAIYSANTRAPADQRLTFASIETLNGNSGLDEFLIGLGGVVTQSITGGADTSNTLIGRDAANEWSITGTNTGELHVDDGGAQFDNPYVSSFSSIQNITGGSSTDSFVIGDAGEVTGEIDGGLGANELTGRNAANEWDVNTANGGGLYIDNNADGFGTAYVNTFSNIQTLNGGTAGDRFVMGLNGSIDAINGVGTANNTLIARTGVDNIWTFNTLDSGSLAQAGVTPDPDITYVSSFTGIQNFVGSNSDWANLSGFSAAINVSSYTGFAGVIGNGSTILNGTDNGDIWSIASIDGPNGPTDGRNDGEVTFGINTLRFVDFGTIIGGSGDDLFTIGNSDTLGNAASIGLINGGGGSNTLTGHTGGNGWTLTAVTTDTGELNPTTGPITNFENIQNLTGSSGVDTFTFETDARLTGLLNGGVGADILNITALTNDTTLRLADAVIAVNNPADELTTYSIETINANNLSNNRLVGTSLLNTWLVSTANSGNINDGAIIFNGFANLEGSDTANDSFVVNSSLTSINTGNGNNNVTVNTGGSVTSSITGGSGVDTLQIDGGSGAINTGAGNDTITVAGTVNGVIDGGNDNDVLNITAAGNQIVQISPTVVSDEDYTVNQIETINANNAAGGNSLRVAGGNTWNVNTNNSGTVGSTSFSNFANLVGGTGNDVFTVSAALSSIDAGNGNNTITVNTLGNVSTGINTGTGNDIITVTGTSGSVNAGDGTNSVTVNNGGTVTGAITGGSGVDTIVVNGTAGSINARGNADIITISGTVSGLIDGDTGTDVLSITSTANQVVQLGATSTTGTTLLVNNIETINANASTVNELRGANGVTNTWNIGTAPTNNNRVNDGALTTVFSNFENLLGGTGNDTFTVGSTSTLNSINTGDGTNNVTVNTGGTVTGAITGGSGVDTIVVNGTAGSIDARGNADAITISGTVSGLIDGGTELGTGTDTDTLTITSTGNQVVQLGTVSTTGTDYLVNNIETINATNGASGNELRAITDIDNAWVINASNRGFINSAVTFSNFANLTGGELTDSFSLINTGTITGLINGAGGNDTLAVNVSNVIIEITGDNRTTPNINVYQIETINNTGTNNALMGDTTDNTWNIDATTTLGVTNAPASVTFTGFNRLLGNTGVDTFEMDVVTNDLTINGGDGDDIFNINADTNNVTLYGDNDSDQFNLALSAYTSLTLYGGDDTTDTDNNDALGNTILGANLTLGTQPSAGGVTSSGIESVAGNYGQLTAEDGLDINWTINGRNSGTAQWTAGNTNYTVNFFGFSTLNGSEPNAGNVAGNDSFTVVGTGQITGNGGVGGFIYGRGGDDSLTVNFTGTPIGETTFNGGTGTNTVTINGTTPYTSVVYTPYAFGGYDQLAYYTSGGSYNVNYQNADTVTSNTEVTTLYVNGTGVVDTITLDRADSGNGIMNNFTLSGHTTAYYNATNVSVDAGSGSDTIVVNNIDLGSAGTLTLDSETIAYDNATADPVITAMSLIIENLDNLFSTGNPLTTNISNLSLINSTSDIAITNVGDVHITQLDNIGTFDLTATNGNITSGSLVSGSPLSLTALNGGIDLNDTGNNLTGLLTLNATGDIDIFNNTSTNISSINSQSLNINSAGDIIGSGNVIVTGTTTLSSDADIYLNDPDNNFGQVSVTTANNVTLNDVNSLTIGNINATENVTVTSNGLALGSVSGIDVSLNSGSGAISDNNGGAINVTANTTTLRSDAGIGSTNAIETNTAILDVINTASGNINIDNSGAVLLTNLVNLADSGIDNAITFNNQGDVTLDRVEADYNNGTVTLYINNGSVFGVMSRIDSNGNTIPFGNMSGIPDIKSNELVLTTNRNFGTFDRPIVVDVRTQFTLIAAGGYLPVELGPGELITASDLQSSFLGSISAISGQQLIELESLADIDPAIFTNIRNYSYDDLAIRMPADQRYDDEEEQKY